jgi:hypothetical protein
VRSLVQGRQGRQPEGVSEEWKIWVRTKGRWSRLRRKNTMDTCVVNTVCPIEIPVSSMLTQSQFCLGVQPLPL